MTDSHSPDGPGQPGTAASRPLHDLAVPDHSDLAHLARPPWLSRLERRLDQSRAPQTRGSRARRAAVLVVLVAGDGDGEPDLFLTRRSDGLEYLPGALAFPGGSVERSDRSPVDTALREANEETGLDPSSVEILGRLSERSTPDARFVVTPVVAWSRHLGFNTPISPDEVTAIGLVQLAMVSQLRSDSHVALRRIAGGGPGQPKSASLGVLPPMTAGVVCELVGLCQRGPAPIGRHPRGQGRLGSFPPKGRAGDRAQAVGSARRLWGSAFPPQCP
ncbi:MAG: NUDIX hydrolase [Acidimicrobiales bacterium]